MTKGDATCSLPVRFVVAAMYVVLHINQNDKPHGALKQRASTERVHIGQETKCGGVLSCDVGAVMQRSAVVVIF